MTANSKFSCHENALVFRTFALALAVSLFALSACAKSESGFIKAIERSAQIASASTNPVVTVSALTDFQWDKLFVFGPYTPIQKIHAQLGFTWAEAEKTHIDSSDAFYLLVFVKDGKVARHFKLPRTIGDFQTSETTDVFTPGNDTFEVKSVNAGSATRFNFWPKQPDQPCSPSYHSELEGKTYEELLKPARCQDRDGGRLHQTVCRSPPSVSRRIGRK